MSETVNFFYINAIILLIGSSTVTIVNGETYMQTFYYSWVSAIFLTIAGRIYDYLDGLVEN